MQIRDANARAGFQATCYRPACACEPSPPKSVALRGWQMIIVYARLPLITFTSKLKSFCFHSCSVCTIGKLFILARARVYPHRIISGDGWERRDTPEEGTVLQQERQKTRVRWTFVTVSAVCACDVIAPLPDIFVARTWRWWRGKGGITGRRYAIVLYVGAIISPSSKMDILRYEIYNIINKNHLRY